MADASPPEKPKCPEAETFAWLEEPIEGWEATVDDWDWIADDPNDPVTWVKKNPCPRCKHTMWVEKGGANAERAYRERTVPEWTDAACNCERTACHSEGRQDDDARGCGQQGWIRPPGWKEHAA